eukprot:662983-Pyramimonas_sp.AAC.1
MMGAASSSFGAALAVVLHIVHAKLAGSETLLSDGGFLFASRMCLYIGASLRYTDHGFCLELRCLGLTTHPRPERGGRGKLP